MQTLITPEQLAAGLGRRDWLVFDCRFSLLDPAAGRRAYDASHIPGAIFVDLNRDLSAPHVPGVTGRHPLPERDAWISRVQAWGIEPSRQAVMYDDAGGAAAARMWWMLRWIGHAGAAVLDGGWQAWTAQGLPVTSAAAPRTLRADFRYGDRPSLTRLIQAEAIDGEAQLLLDAREPSRFRGDEEPIDPVAGHIPGARCSPFSANLEDGRFRSPDQLREKFLAAGAGEGREVVSYCGSGVTAAHNILAMKIAGFEEPLLYSGSWSEWITDPSRGVAKGD